MLTTVDLTEMTEKQKNIKQEQQSNTTFIPYIYPS